MQSFVFSGLVMIAFVAGVIGSCGQNSGTITTTDERFVELDLGRRATDELVGYYLAPFSEGEDPFEARLVVKDDGGYFVDTEALFSADSISARRLWAAAGDDGEVDWDAFAGFASDTYYRARNIPALRDEFFAQETFGQASRGWMRVDVNGVMTTQRRRVYVRQADVVDALRAFRSQEDRLIYPTGTVFIAEHVEGSDVSETTVMRKTRWGDWDFFGYDREGRLADSTLAMPDSRRIPVQCVGCHFGSKLFEPERSFPAVVADGPRGPRAVHVDDSVRDAAVVRYFDEHRHRSDRVLGLYATILVSRLRIDRKMGILDNELADLLESLDL